MTQTLAIQPREFPSRVASRVESSEQVAFHEHLRHQPCRSADTFCVSGPRAFDLKVAEENRAYRDAVERAALFARSQRVVSTPQGTPRASGDGVESPRTATHAALSPAKLADVRPIPPALKNAAEDVIAIARAIIAAREGRRMIDVVV